MGSVVQACACLLAVFAAGRVSACACVRACVRGERRDATARPRKSDGGDGGGNEKDGADGRREISERGLRHVRTIIALVGEGKIL